MKPIAYSYKRWSSAIQGKGHTDERQIQLAEEYAAREELTFDTRRKMSDSHRGDCEQAVRERVASEARSQAR